MRSTKLTDYVKTAEAAEILGVAQNTLRKWAARGDKTLHVRRLHQPLGRNGVISWHVVLFVVSRSP